MAAPPVSGAPGFGAAALRLGGAMARLAGWTPADFWAATPAEAVMVLNGWTNGETNGVAPPDAATRARLMEQFPDDR